MAESKDFPGCGHEYEFEHEHGTRHREKHDKGRYGNIRDIAGYEEMDIDNKLIMNLRDLGHVIRFLSEGKGSQSRILIILQESGSMTQRELTHRLGIQPGSASEVIGKLESAGLILRSSSQEDRRTANIDLTPEGHRQAQEAISRRKIRQEEMFVSLTEEEKDTLLGLTEKLNVDWNDRYRRKEGEQAWGKKKGLHGHH